MAKRNVPSVLEAPVVVVDADAGFEPEEEDVLLELDATETTVELDNADDTEPESDTPEPRPMPAALDDPDHVIKPADQVIAPPAPIVPALSHADAVARATAMLEAFLTGGSVEMNPDLLKATLAGLAKPAPAASKAWDGTHSGYCGAYGPCTCAKGPVTISAALVNLSRDLHNGLFGFGRRVGVVATDTGLRVGTITTVGSRSTSGTSGTSTGTPRATPVRTVPAGSPQVFYRGEGMSLAQATTKAAEEFDTAIRCKAYVTGRAAGTSLNARVFLSADVTNGRIPAGVITYPGEQAAAAA